jgi:hypothetical protein
LLDRVDGRGNWRLTRFGQGILAGDRSGPIGLPIIL